MRLLAILLSSFGLFGLSYALIEPRPVESRSIDRGAITADRADDSFNGETALVTALDLPTGTMHPSDRIPSAEQSRASALARKILIPALKKRHQSRPDFTFSRAMILPPPVDIVLEFDEVRGDADGGASSVTGVAHVTRDDPAVTMEFRVDRYHEVPTTIPVATHRFRVDLDHDSIVLIGEDGAETAVVETSPNSHLASGWQLDLGELDLYREAPLAARP